MAEPSLELAWVERVEAEVVVELVSQIEFVEAVAADEQEQRLDALPGLSGLSLVRTAIATASREHDAAA